EEVEHFNMFADLFSILTGSDYSLTPEQLKKAGAWPENDALVAMRKKHIVESAEIGPRATRFTEGGYVAFFSEGMKLAGGYDFESALAKICKIIHDDEFNHMLLGIIETDSHKLSETDWQMLERFTVEQTKQRVVMRNAQFSHPVSEGHMSKLLDGEATPISFDFDYAAELLNKQAA
ncbi:MAG: hypothetical protein KAJ95_10910, partial [Gammaproteobacteria bacterium]|nr:hypothetical protein [Gammaproteobacteria bacterium]